MTGVLLTGGATGSEGVGARPGPGPTASPSSLLRLILESPAVACPVWRFLPRGGAVVTGGAGLTSALGGMVIAAGGIGSDGILNRRRSCCRTAATWCRRWQFNRRWLLVLRLWRGVVLWRRTVQNVKVQPNSGNQNGCRRSIANQARYRRKLRRRRCWLQSGRWQRRPQAACDETRRIHALEVKPSQLVRRKTRSLGQRLLPVDGPHEMGTIQRLAPAATLLSQEAGSPNAFHDQKSWNTSACLIISSSRSSQTSPARSVTTSRRYLSPVATACRLELFDDGSVAVRVRGKDSSVGPRVRLLIVRFRRPLIHFDAQLHLGEQEISVEHGDRAANDTPVH